MNNVGCRRFGMEKIPSLQHSMLLHSIPSTKKWSVKVRDGQPEAVCLEVLL
jgi:hypothetical protein